MTVNLLSSHKNPRYISMLMIASCHDAKSLYAGVAVVFASPSSAAEYMEFGPCAPPQGQGAKGMGFRVSSCSRPSDLVRGLISHRTLSILVCRLLCAIGWRVCACASQGFSKPQSLHHFLQPARCCESFLQARFAQLALRIASA